MTDNVNPSDLLKTYSKDYLPSSGMFLFTQVQNRPQFSRNIIREMLADPRITYGLWLLKGPIISNARFEVEADNGEIKQFVQDNLERFWRNSASRVLKALEWGFSGSEVIYRLKDGRIHFDVVKDFDPYDVTPVRHDGNLIGMYVRNNRDGKTNKVYIGQPKSLWHVHWRDRSPWWGISRLYSAHIPWWEKWCDGGFRDIRRLWYYKNAFEGGTMYHPPGSTKDASGALIANKDLAREMLEKKRSGATLTLPNSLAGDGGMRAWEYAPPVANPTPEGMADYGHDLDTEILEAMGIPPEVIESSGNQGFGSSTGRQVPQDAFYAILDELIMWLMMDFDSQCLRTLVKVNYGEEYEYEIYAVPLGESQNGMDQPGDFHENQYLDEEGDAKSQDEIDQEEADRYEKARSSSLKSFQMDASVGQMSNAKWVTIGGHRGEGGNHVGGFPVMLNSNGEIIAGGPRGLKGKHVTDSGAFLDKKGRDSRAKERTDPRTPFHDKHRLPSPGTHIHQALEEYAGDNPEDQAAFLKLVKEVHAEHLGRVANRRKLDAGADRKFQAGADLSKIEGYAQESGIKLDKAVKDLLNKSSESFTNQRDLKRLFADAAKRKAKDIKGQKGTKKGKDGKAVEAQVKPDSEYIKEVLAKRETRRTLSQSRNWSTVSKTISETLDVPKAQVESEAENLYEQMHGAAKAKEAIKAKVRKLYGIKANENDPEMYRTIENMDFDTAYSSLYDEAGTYFPHLLEGGKESGDAIREMMLEPKKPLPTKTSDEFLQALFDRLSGDGDVSEVELHDPIILNEALSRWNQATDFDPAEFDF